MRVNLYNTLLYSVEMFHPLMLLLIVVVPAFAVCISLPRPYHKL